MASKNNLVILVMNADFENDDVNYNSEVKAFFCQLDPKPDVLLLQNVKARDCYDQREEYFTALGGNKIYTRVENFEKEREAEVFEGNKQKLQDWRFLGITFV